MKKTIVLLLCTTLLTGLVGCGGLNFSADLDMSGLEFEVNSDSDVSEETESEVPEGAVGELVAQIEKDGPTESGTTEDNTTWYSYANVFSSDDYAPVAAEKAVNAAEVYANLEYEPAMFYGTYHMSFLESDELEAPYDPNKTFLDSCEWVPYEDMFGEESFFWEQIATVPHYMCAGYGSATWSPLLTLKEYEWCQLYFAVKDEDGELSHEQYMADYSVSGSTITYHILDNYYYDRTTEVLTYEFSDVYLTYNFEFCGSKLILSNDTQSVELFAEEFCHKDLSYPIIYVDNTKVSSGSEMIDNIVSFDFAHENYDDYDYFHVKVDEGGAEPVEYTGSMKLHEDGRMSFSYTDNNVKTHAYEYVVFLCGEDGIILTDGVNNYYYVDTLYTKITDGFLAEMNVNVAEEDRELLESMTDEQIEIIYAKRDALFKDLISAFEAENIAVSVNSKTGEIALDSEVLFPVNGDALSEEGKVVVDKFINVFMEVLEMPQYEGFISEVVVEGHTDTSGDYDYNLSLSQRRADAVKEYCINGAGLDAADASKLSEMLVAQGCSYDEPVYNANGEVDMDASRRVSFVFYIDLSSF